MKVSPTTNVAGMSFMSAFGATSLKGAESWAPLPGVVGAMPFSAKQIRYQMQE